MGKVIIAGVEVHSYKCGAPMFSSHDVALSIAADIQAGTYFRRKLSMHKKDIDEARQSVNESVDMLDHSIARMCEKADLLSLTAKKASSNTRDSANKLNEAIIKLQKQADFEKLERYVALLERASIALNKLSELNDTGKLGKIIESLK